VATASELRNLDDAELRDQLQGCYEELFNLRFQKVTGSMNNSARPRQVKKDIARIKTILRERALAQETAS
jgi:large subunit ribosomal protein L29